MPDCVYTIGHSTHSMEKFIELLAMHDVTVVADIRSRPYSRFTPQFNRESLQADLKAAGLGYVFLGRECGARTEDPACYVDGKVQYDRVARTTSFKQGLVRLAQGVRTHRIVLMCAEKDPLTCHRAILVCRHLEPKGITARHILEDGRIEPHDEAVERLLVELGYTGPRLFQSRDDMIVDAYDQRGREIAYVQESPEQPTVKVRG